MSDLKSKAPLAGLLCGVLCTQFVNSALHLAQPLLLTKISGSVGLAAFFSSFDTAVHMLGTFTGGWPTDRYGARRVLIVSTFLRGMALLAIPVGFLMGVLNIYWAMVWYTLDAFVRGFVDSSVHTVPLELGEHFSTELDKINSRYEFTFDLGGIAGPLVLGGLMLWSDAIAPHLLIPIGFMLSALAYTWIPKRTVVRKAMNSAGTIQGLKIIFSERGLLTACLGICLFNIYPLRKLLAAFFASSLIAQPPMAGILGAGFGAGGLIGALFYAKSKFSMTSWIALGAAGMIVIATGWMPANLPLMVTAAFIFAFTNVGARLALTRRRQELTPLEAAGGVTAASQFGANILSVVLKAMVGVAFTIGAGPQTAFGIVAIGLTAMALAQMALRKVMQSPATVTIPRK